MPAAVICYSAIRPLLLYNSVGGFKELAIAGCLPFLLLLSLVYVKQAPSICLFGIFGATPGSKSSPNDRLPARPDPGREKS